MQDREWCQFAVISHLKKPKQSRVVKPVTFFKYNDPDMCVVTTQTYYMKRTSSLVPPTDNILFITHGKSNQKPSKDTVRRWILEILNRAGINTSKYITHSTRHASSSKSLSQGLNVQSILSNGGWKSENVFRKHYQLPIMKPDTPVMVATPSERNDISMTIYDIEIYFSVKKNSFL